MKNHPDIFEPFDSLVTIRVLGKEVKVPEVNSILRGFQFLDIEGVSDGEFCWNGECLNCQVGIKTGPKVKSVMSCRTNALEGMEIVEISKEIARAAADILEMSEGKRDLDRDIHQLT